MHSLPTTSNSDPFSPYLLSNPCSYFMVPSSCSIKLSYLCIFLIFIFTLFYFTVLYWFCHTLTWIHHGCTWVPKHEPPSHLPPHIISLDHPCAPVPSILYPASNIDWRFVSYMVVYMFQRHSPKPSHPLPLPQSPCILEYLQFLNCETSCIPLKLFQFENWEWSWRHNLLEAITSTQWPTV